MHILEVTPRIPAPILFCHTKDLPFAMVLNHWEVFWTLLQGKNKASFFHFLGVNCTKQPPLKWKYKVKRTAAPSYSQVPGADIKLRTGCLVVITSRSAQGCYGTKTALFTFISTIVPQHPKITRWQGHLGSVSFSSQQDLSESSRLTTHLRDLSFLMNLKKE